MEQAPGFQVNGNRLVCELIKSLYGLKQAPFVWNQTLHRYLISLGFARLDSDYGLYVRKVGGTGVIDLILTVYVDDLLLMGLPNKCAAVYAQLRTEFEMVALGPVKYLLGVEVIIDFRRQTVFYSQATYATTVLKRFHVLGCNPVATPESETRLSVPKQKNNAPMPYRELVGALQYLVSHSRPDVAHAVRALSQKTSDFTWEDYCKGLRVLRYLQGTVHYGVLFKVRHNQAWNLTVFTDSDHARDPIDRKSISGYVSQIDGNSVAWGSHKQSIVAQSTMEAEYIACNEGVRDLMWVQSLCQELKQECDVPLLRSDNTASIFLMQRPGKHNKSKHIEIKYHYVRHFVEQDQLLVEHCRSDTNTADIFTKPLGRTKFEKFRQQLGVVERNTAL
jgi:Reverse transcriptase (RNA-dependent DNA polymerase)